MLNFKIPEVFTELESVVLRYLLQEESTENLVLCKQLESCSIESRERNGYGIYTHFKIADSVPQTERSNFELGDITVVLSGELCTFILFVRDGRIAFLEGVPLGGDAWPTTEIIEKVSRFNTC